MRQAGADGQLSFKGPLMQQLARWPESSSERGLSTLTRCPATGKVPGKMSKRPVGTLLVDRQDVLIKGSDRLQRQTDGQKDDIFFA